MGHLSWYVIHQILITTSSVLNFSPMQADDVCVTSTTFILIGLCFLVIAYTHSLQCSYDLIFDLNHPEFICECMPNYLWPLKLDHYLIMIN